MLFKIFRQAWLREQLRCAGFKRPLLDRVEGVPRQDDDWDVAGARVVLQPLRGSGPGHVRHGEIHDDHVRPGGERQLDALRPVGSSQDAEAAIAQVLGVYLAHIQGVVHNKNERYTTRTPYGASLMVGQW